MGSVSVHGAGSVAGLPLKDVARWQVVAPFNEERFVDIA
jgi:hypothetical protein